MAPGFASGAILSFAQNESKAKESCIQRRWLII
jgi:hypothetical protein